MQGTGIRLDGTFTVPCSRDTVEGFFADLDRVLRCLPGLQQVNRVADNLAEVVLNVGISSIQGPIKVRLERRTGPDGVVFHGQGGGLGSAVDLECGITLSDTGRGETEVRWYGEAQVGGRLASLAGGLLQWVAKKNATEFVRNLEVALRGLT